MKKLMISAGMTAMIAFCLSAATWEKVYPELGNSKASRVCQTSDGGYAFTGNKYIAEADSLGNLLWYKIYRQDSYTSNQAIKEIPDGGLAVLSYHEVTGEIYGNFWLLRTDSQGDTLWTRNYGTSKRYPFDMDITSDSGFIMSGKVILPSGKANVYLVRADKNGNLLWERSYTQGAWGISHKNSRRFLCCFDFSLR